METLIDARDSARRVRDFDTADDVREVLMQDWGVALDDDARLWWVGPRNDARLANFGLALPPARPSPGLPSLPCWCAQD